MTIRTAANSATPADAPFVHEIVLARPIATVWTALVRKDIVDKYYLAPLGADIATVGSEVFYGLPSNKMIVGTVLAVEAPTRLVHTFRFASDSGPDTTVTYALAATGSGTVLRIEHRGYPDPSQGYSDIAMGWPIIAGRLKALLEGTA